MRKVCVFSEALLSFSFVFFFFFFFSLFFGLAALCHAQLFGRSQKMEEDKSKSKMIGTRETNSC